jgi:hypothetical protein
MKTSAQGHFDQKKIILSISMISIMMLVSVFNQLLLTPQKPKGNQSRAIASFGDSRDFSFNQVQRDWEYKLAEKLSKEGSKDMSSIGRRPDPFDQLRFGLLEGKYSFLLENGKIKKIEFVETDTDRPKYINRKDFLETHNGLLDVSFDKVLEITGEGPGSNKIPVTGEGPGSNKIPESSDSKKVEGTRSSQVSIPQESDENGFQKDENGFQKSTFDLLDASSEQVGKAHFLEDEFGRLLHFEVEAPGTQLR